MPLALRLASRVGLLIGLLSLIVSCATPANVRVSEFADISRYRTWDWLISNGGRVDAQSPGDTSFEQRVARVVETALSDHGFRRDPSRPSVLVYFYVGIQRQLVKQIRTGAINVVSSLHESPSYWVQASETEHRYYEIAELRIVLVDAAERRVIWRGVLEGRYHEKFEPHLGEVVAELVGHLPRPQSPGPTRVVDAAPPRVADDPPQS